MSDSWSSAQPSPSGEDANNQLVSSLIKRGSAKQHFPNVPHLHNFVIRTVCPNLQFGSPHFIGNCRIVITKVIDYEENSNHVYSHIRLKIMRLVIEGSAFVRTLKFKVEPLTMCIFGALI